MSEVAGLECMGSRERGHAQVTPENGYEGVAMHFTEPVYRNPYWPTWPLLEVTRGCTHNRCKFCTMYKSVPFGTTPMSQIEEDLAELAATVPNARTIQLLSANPLVLTYDKLAAILEKIREYLPKMEHVYTVGRVTDRQQ